MFSWNLNIYKLDTIQKDQSSHTKQYQTYFRMIKSDKLNFRGVQNGYHEHF